MLSVKTTSGNREDDLLCNSGSAFSCMSINTIIRVRLSALALTICKFCVLAPLRKHKTLHACHQSSSHTLLQQLHWLPAEYHINLEIAMSLSIQHIPRSVLTYFRPCMLIIQLAPSGCPAPICSRFHSYALHSAPTASVLQAP